MNKKKPRFTRQYAHMKARTKERPWRKPRGIDSYQRRGLKAKGAKPRVGFANPREVRGLHPSGMRELLVRNEKDLAGAKGVAVRLASGLGEKKRAAIRAKAAEMKLAVLN
jgi:large subunit ribosomal protein L32e